jgi:phosphate-selective porin/Arc/MetJ-type ribon-helix-helix transcriptional regulator
MANKEDKVTIKIPRQLYQKINEVIKKSGFDSATDFIVYCLRDLVADKTGKDNEHPLTNKEVQIVRKRLKSLGYLCVFLFSLLAGISLFTPSSFAVESDVDRLLDLLVKKGVVTTQEAVEFRAELAVKKQEEKDQQKEFVLTAGKPIKISGYTQVRYRKDKSTNDGLDIRRARLTAAGDITERFDYKTQVEFGGGSTPFLLDAALGYKANPYLKLTAGQFIIPFSMENVTSEMKMQTINRSQVVEALAARGTDVIGNQNGRDIGVQASGSLLPREDYYLADYAVGVFNGAGINKSADTNEQKDFIGRVVFHPVKDLSVGGSYYAGRYTLATTPNVKNDRDRVGAEVAYAKDSLSLKSEYIKGNDGPTNRDGWYAQGGYFFIPNKFQGVLKFDTYDPDTDAGHDATNVYTLGANWHFNKWAYVQVDYEFKDEMGKETDNDVLISQVTLQF